MKGNLFAPVVDAFVRNNGRYNLLESAILELFEFIKIEDIKSLYTYFVENFGKIFDDVQYVQTFKTLKNKYDQQQDRLKEKEKGNLDRYGVVKALRNSSKISILLISSVFICFFSVYHRFCGIVTDTGGIRGSWTKRRRFGSTRRKTLPKRTRPDRRNWTLA